MFLKLRKPEKHAKVRINEHNTKEKPKFLLLLSNESTFGAANGTHKWAQYKGKAEVFTFIVEQKYENLL